jgi:hypothetical protein
MPSSSSPPELGGGGGGCPLPPPRRAGSLVPLLPPEAAVEEDAPTTSGDGLPPRSSVESIRYAWYSVVVEAGTEWSGEAACSDAEASVSPDFPLAASGFAPWATVPSGETDEVDSAPNVADAPAMDG